jgi:hypothetical protein
MISGTLENLASSAYVPTPTAVAAAIARNLLALPTADYSVLDPTAGEGHLLEPLQYDVHAQLYGIELSDERAAAALLRLPRAQVVTAPFEHTRVTAGSVSLVLANPPYLWQNGLRAEYAILRDAGMSLQPGGILVAILPARSAWDGLMARHWWLHYDDVRCWKLADEVFTSYTQIVVVGKRRAVQRAGDDLIDKAELMRLRGFRYLGADPDHPGRSPWAQGFPPPELPNAPLSEPYAVPPQPSLPVTITIVKADEATLLRGLEQSGVHLNEDWRGATTWSLELEIDRPLMPIAGEAHLASLILTGA